MDFLDLLDETDRPTDDGQCYKQGVVTHMRCSVSLSQSLD